MQDISEGDLSRATESARTQCNCSRSSWSCPSLFLPESLFEGQSIHTSADGKTKSVMQSLVQLLEFLLQVIIGLDQNELDGQTQFHSRMRRAFTMQAA